MSSQPETIRDRILAYRAEMEAGDPNGLGLKLREAAVSAIYGGFGSQSWRDYMKLFASTPKQMRRLCTREIDCHPYNEPARAYLVGNALCFPGTWRAFMDGVEEWLDITLDQFPDNY
jgi:hypothetical protein